MVTSTEWSEHPPHLHVHSVRHSNGVSEIVDPPPRIQGEGIIRRLRRHRECRLKGGHWWHPEGMIDWFCCYCGKQTDGFPKDGH
jgi:hypothetical protein